MPAAPRSLLIAVDGPAASGKGSIARALAAHFGLPQVDPADEELRSEIVGSIASRISAYPAVRAALLERQRAFAAQDGGAVLDGRDIGTVIAPDATVKLYVTATAEERARRRLAELDARGANAHYDDVLADIRARDQRDARRAAAPLLQAPDAILLDTTGLTLDAAIAEAIRLVEERVAASKHGLK